MLMRWVDGRAGGGGDRLAVPGAGRLGARSVKLGLIQREAAEMEDGSRGHLDPAGNLGLYSTGRGLRKHWF